MPKYEIIVEETIYKTYHVETDKEIYREIEQEFYEMDPDERDEALVEVEQSKYSINHICHMEEEEAHG